ncbi:MAG: hypothetical protein LBN34_05405 [Clostridiales Family XIII bacterium]|jgi:hypothetical protein|nr:hypothetical protein [Clostridiales Family XIII bacterium]
MTPYEYTLEMQEYLNEYRKKPIPEQEKIAKEALISSGLFDENGEFTDNYAYSREYYRKKLPQFGANKRGETFHVLHYKLHIAGWAAFAC